MDKQLKDKLVEYLLTIPQLLFAVVLSFFSGHLWLWIVHTYFDSPAKGAKYLSNIWAKTALGLFWYVLFLLPNFVFRFGIHSEVDGNIIQVIGWTLLIGSFVQAVATILIVNFKKTSK